MQGTPQNFTIYSLDFPISVPTIIRSFTVAGDETSVNVVLVLEVHKGNLLLLTVITWKILVLELLRGAVNEVV